MNILSIIFIIYTALLGVVVLKRNFKSSENKWFSIVIFSSFLWILTNFLVDSITSPDLVLWSARLTLLGPVILGPSFFIFSICFTSGKKISSLSKKVLILLSILPFILLLPTS